MCLQFWVVFFIYLFPCNGADKRNFSPGISGDMNAVKTTFQHPCDPARSVHVVIDPPHVFKCVRNNLQKVGKFLVRSVCICTNCVCSTLSLFVTFVIVTAARKPRSFSLPLRCPTGVWNGASWAACGAQADESARCSKCIPENECPTCCPGKKLN